MSFITLEYLIFLPLVFLFFYIIPKKLTVIYLLIASYSFYFISAGLYIIPLIVSTCIDYFSCLYLDNPRYTEHRRKIVTFSICSNLCLLGYFKYYNFFIQNLTDIFQILSLSPPHTLSYIHIILPVGISFYTFQTIGHTIDVYRGDTRAHKDFKEFALYVTFFPQLVAGPIERSKDLIPQFYKLKEFNLDSIKSGMILILWGLLKKIAIADQLSLMTQKYYGKVQAYQTIDTWLALICFSIQIYCDFSGYTDMARGSARLFNINLRRNFEHPYGAKSLGQLWKRWHISLTSWFKDYLYRPLASTKSLKHQRLLISFIVFFLMGLWHGASWPFISFGLFNALGLMIEKYILPFEQTLLKRLSPKIQSIFYILQTQFLFIFCGQGFIIRKMSDYPDIIMRAFNFNFEKLGKITLIQNQELLLTTLFLWTFVYLTERQIFHGSAKLTKRIKKKVIQYFFPVTFAFIMLIILFGEWGNEEFIYYRF